MKEPTIDLPKVRVRTGPDTAELVESSYRRNGWSVCSWDDGSGVYFICNLRQALGCGPEKLSHEEAISLCRALGDAVPVPYPDMPEAATPEELQASAYRQAVDDLLDRWMGERRVVSDAN